MAAERSNVPAGTQSPAKRERGRVSATRRITEDPNSRSFPSKCQKLIQLIVNQNIKTPYKTAQRMQLPLKDQDQPTKLFLAFIPQAHTPAYDPNCTHCSSTGSVPHNQQLYPCTYPPSRHRQNSQKDIGLRKIRYCPRRRSNRGRSSRRDRCTCTSC